MKKLLMIVLCAGSLIANVPLIAQDSSIVINDSETHSVFTGFFKSVWAKLKSLNPTQKQSAQSTQVYTAGIRGAESTDTLLQPYWKDDLTQDEEFQNELQKFSLAQQKMDKGELEAAVKSFDEFLQEYSQSSLRPNALFGKSISLAGIGRNEQSLSTMQQFVQENPNHPLVADANQVINELQ
jgi:TolA-binding protein